jgi:tight adherence protein B
VTGVLLGLVFAAGVALLWAGLVLNVNLPRRGSLIAPALAEAGIRLRPVTFVLLVAASAALGAALAWSITAVPILVLAAATAGAYAPLASAWRRRDRARRERERAWPAALAQLADALEAGIAFPAAVAFVAEAGPAQLRSDLAGFHARLRSGGLEQAIEGLRESGERTADTVALLLRAGLLELPAGRLAPVLRELAAVLSERFEAREKARSRASTLQIEAAILALSPIALLLIVGAASPGYLDAYRTPAGTVVAAVAGLLIFGCYLAMRQLGRVPEPRRPAGGNR